MDIKPIKMHVFQKSATKQQQQQEKKKDRFDCAS